MSQNVEQLLQRAYAAETTAIGLLRLQLGSAVDPAFREKITEYLTETRWQRKLLRACIVNFTENEVPAAENDEAELAGEDLLSCVQYQIRLYRQLVSEAQKAGLDVVVEAAREILVQERAMEEWLDVYAEVFQGIMPARNAIGSSRAEW
ncbi:MAG TPA: hypothetical protein VEF76_09095 [Patescibacteria group bacterium]|nr:hypothetical protein [Patescibacteria group bacterium]